MSSHCFVCMFCPSIKSVVELEERQQLINWANPYEVQGSVCGCRYDPFMSLTWYRATSPVDITSVTASFEKSVMKPRGSFLKTVPTLMHQSYIVESTCQLYPSKLLDDSDIPQKHNTRRSHIPDLDSSSIRLEGFRTAFHSKFWLLRPVAWASSSHTPFGCFFPQILYFWFQGCCRPSKISFDCRNVIRKEQFDSEKKNEVIWLSIRGDLI